MESALLDENGEYVDWCEDHWWWPSGPLGELTVYPWCQHRWDLRQYQGQVMTFKVWLTILSPDMPTWAYVDVTGQVSTGPFWRAVEVHLPDDQLAIGATVRPVWLDGEGKPFTVDTTKDIMTFTDHSGRANTPFWGDPVHDRWGFAVDYFESVTGKHYYGVTGPIRQGEVPILKLAER